MTTKTLDPGKITPEAIIGMATRRGLRLIPGTYLTVDSANKPVGCCPAGVLAIESREDMPRGEMGFYFALKASGIPDGFRHGLAEGFDGDPPGRLVGQPDYDRGYALGRATRLAAGIENTGVAS